MLRSPLLLPASLLLSCAPAGLDTGAAAPEVPSVALPAGASPTWLETAKTRIAASARSIVPENGALVAALPAHRAVARFTDEGLVLGELDAAAPLELRFTSWGAAGAERAVEPVSPTLGACLTELLPEGDCARQLEYAHEGVTAWWVGLDHGVEFGWTVAAPPAEGGEELVFEVEVSGADWLEASGDGAELVDASGETWTVSGALAWGADGAALPAWLEVEGDALVVRVEAGGAVYPVTVDPVLEEATTTLTGLVEFDGFGISVSGAGDVNGDGFDDVIIGAPRSFSGSLEDAGAAYVHHGSRDGVSSTASLTLTGASEDNNLGISVAGAGDVNGDGYDDVIIGASEYDAGFLEDAGAAYIHHGSPGGVSASPNLLVAGTDGEELGFSVAGAGDVNGDGYDDVIIGAPVYYIGGPRSEGHAYIHHGSSSGVSSGASTTLTGEAIEDYFGVAVAGAGDVNGDGYDDVIIGAVGRDSDTTVDVGAAYIHHGSSSGVSSRASRTLMGERAADKFGRSVSGVGDVNGDSYDDVIIGAYGYRRPSIAAPAGRVYIHHGSSSGVSSGASVTLTGERGVEYLGISVAGAGDVNGDGYGDVIIGAGGREVGSLLVGAATILNGSSSGASLDASSTLTGSSERDQFGGCVASAGDVNGDGYDDVIIGGAGDPYEEGEGMGAVYIHHGHGPGGGSDGGGSGKSGCSTSPASPLPWVGALLGLPALVLRRRRA